MAEARWLADHGASAAIDVSDGLVADLGHIAAASSVGVDLDADRVPRLPTVDVELALRSGEEYELAVTAPREFDTAEFERRFAVSLTQIGRIVSAQPGSVRISGVAAARSSGFDHFSSW
jgi:thiamine-monophosphate kinase